MKKVYLKNFDDFKGAVIKEVFSESDFGNNEHSFTIQTEDGRMITADLSGDASLKVIELKFSK